MVLVIHTREDISSFVQNLFSDIKKKKKKNTMRKATHNMGFFFKITFIVGVHDKQ